MEKRWNLLPEVDKVLCDSLAQQLNVNPIIAKLLIRRGVDTFDKARDFFRPQLAHLHDPFLMKDMDKAIDRINLAIANNENIMVYGDYDVDGTTAVALVYSFFKSIYPNLVYYIPDRYKEGYGISIAGIDFAADNNISLIIALDCGIKAIDKIEHANSKNIDFIICDHHRPGSEIPNALAVLDPKRVDCTYPFDELSGCGVGFKLIQAFTQKNELDFDNLIQYLDLVAVSIAADIVPINDENRVLAYYGVKRLNESPRAGFKAIFELANVKREITIGDIVFIIAPRINAAGRMDSGNRAVELLLTDTTASANISGESINITNSERRVVDTEITAQALSMIDDDVSLISRKTTVLFNNSWHKGVVGIVASRLTEKYYRPTIILTESNGLAAGSARSVKDFDVYNAIEQCSDLLEQFGGHKYAAGLTLKLENIQAFIDKFEAVVSSTIEERMLIPEIEMDAQISLEEIDEKFYRILKQFAPFGPGNMSPVFYTHNVVERGYAKIVGNNHLKLEVMMPSTNKTFAAIGFGLGGYIDKIAKRQPFDMCFAIEENEWHGNVSLQLNVKDIKML